MKKILSSCLRFLGFSVSAFFLILCLIILSLQTAKGKEFVKERIVHKAKQAGIRIELDSIEGNIPFEIKIDQLSFSLPDEGKLSIQKLRASLSLYSLFQAKWAISSLTASSVDLVLPEKEEGIFSWEEIQLPNFHIDIQSFNVQKLHVHKKEFSQEYQVEGTCRYKKRGKSFLVDLKAQEGLTQSYLSLQLSEQTLRQNFSLSSEVHLRSLKVLYPFLSLPCEGNVSLYVDLVGSKETVSNLFNKIEDKKHPKPIQGKVELSVHSLSFPEMLPSLPFSVKSQFSLWSDRTVEIPIFHLESALAKVKGKGALHNISLPTSFSSSITIPDLSLWNPVLAGELSGSLSYENNNLIASLESKSIQVENEPFTQAACKIDAKKLQNTWEGTLSASAFHPSAPFHVTSSFDIGSFFPICFKEIQVSSKENDLSGNLTFFSPSYLEGNGRISLRDMTSFAGVFHLPSNLKGSFESKWEIKENSLSSSLEVKDFSWGALSFEQIQGSCDTKHLLSFPQCICSIQAKEGIYQEITLDTLQIDSTYQESILSFSSSGKGTWKEPYSFSLTGELEKREGYIAKIYAFQGSLLHHPFSFTKPYFFSWRKEGFAVQDFSCEIGSGSLTLDSSLSKDVASFAIQGSHVPLDFFSLFSKHMRSSGYFSLSSSYEKNKDLCCGQAKIFLENGQISQPSQSLSEGKGSLFLSLENETLQVLSHVEAKPDQFLDLSLTLPVDCHSFLPKLDVEKQRSISGKCVASGNIEEIFDFLNLGSQRITGELSASLLLFGTTSDPQMHGTFSINNGSYENYTAGSYLKEARIQAQAEGLTLQVVEAYAKDETGGSIFASGEVVCNFQKLFPYSFTASLENLSALKFDNFKGAFSGDLSIEGTLQKAWVKGNLYLPKADITIPDQLPYDLPELPVTYVNMPKEKLPPPPASKIPIELELHLFANKKLYVSGRGLLSEWDGEMNVTTEEEGTRLNGSLNLLRGTFQFAGKTFSLSKGEIVFSGKEKQSMYIDLQGNVDASDVTVIANLRGPLLSPQLTFTSIPPLPTSAILSKLLFNKDVSEISPIQAIQLAQAILSLSGNSGMDVLETIRKSLGVDRFTIASSKTSDEVFVEIGKYLVQGVMVTLKQGSSSSKVTVEVELKHGFVLEGETDRNQEGRFSLKWNYNY